jgi:predicted 3-demethylubiquinone-9 3-methyltransferase (glyoxalase superfamily)
MATVQKIKPCLWFDRDAEAAVALYTSLFPDSRILTTSRYGEGAPMPKGTVMVVEFELAGMKFQALNGGPVFKFTEAISLSVRCEDQAEVDHFWYKLSEGGQPSRCGWLKDRFGLSWQIVPEVLGKLLGSGDAARTQRVMGALMKMSKLDIAILEKAYDG